MKIGSKVFYNPGLRGRHDEVYCPAFNSSYSSHDVGIIKDINNTHALVEWQNLNRVFPKNRVKYKLSKLESYNKFIKSNIRYKQKASEKKHNYNFVKNDIIFVGGELNLITDVYVNAVYKHKDYLCVGMAGNINIYPDTLPDLKKLAHKD